MVISALPLPACDCVIGQSVAIQSPLPFCLFPFALPLPFLPSHPHRLSQCFSLSVPLSFIFSFTLSPPFSQFLSLAILYCNPLTLWPFPFANFTYTSLTLPSIYTSPFHSVLHSLCLHPFSVFFTSYPLFQSPHLAISLCQLH